MEMEKLIIKSFWSLWDLTINNCQIYRKLKKYIRKIIKLKEFKTNYLLLDKIYF